MFTVVSDVYLQEVARGQVLQESRRQLRFPGQAQLQAKAEEPVFFREKVEETQEKVLEAMVSEGVYQPVQLALKHTPKNFYAGGITHCLKQWQRLTSDKWILKLVQGYEIEFHSVPFQAYMPGPLRLKKSDTLQLESALHEFR